MYCKSCERIMPASAFYVSNRSKCKECVKEAVRAHRAENIDYYRAYDRQRANEPQRVAAREAYRKTEAFRQSHDAANARFRENHEAKRKAHRVVQAALRSGKLERHPCFCCGLRAEAHHPDYDAPLAVSWVCTKHHAQLHREHREYLRKAA